jgi:DNA-binding NtrC family response regulator
MNQPTASADSPDRPAPVVVIDDDPQHLRLITEALTDPTLDLLPFSDSAEGLDVALRKRVPIVLVDLVMPGPDGIQVLERIMDAAPSTEVILMTGNYSTDSAVEAIRKGAADYLTKPLDLARLRNRVAQIVAEIRRREKAVQLDEELLKTCQFANMVGRSPAMLEVFARLNRVAPHFRTALVTGATGTGKELVARALHALSPAAKGPFAACNCSAVVETLFESELFGHVKGAFTGAAQNKVGLFEYANGGTLLLDEIGDMPLAMQAKLLRVLQESEIRRVGSPTSTRVDVRVVAATNRNLKALVAERQFREDLYYRLSMVELNLPRLAERRDDLPLLLQHFLRRFSAQYSKPLRGFSYRAQAVLSRYPWPGNIRELENVVGHAAMMTHGDLVDVRDLPESLLGKFDFSAVADEGLLPLDELSRRHALRVLKYTGGNKVRAAEILGIGRTTLYRLLEDVEQRTAEAEKREGGQQAVR